jgi:hypothetical protein
LPDSGRRNASYSIINGASDMNILQRVEKLAKRKDYRVYGTDDEDEIATVMAKHTDTYILDGSLKTIRAFLISKTATKVQGFCRRLRSIEEEIDVLAAMTNFVLPAHGGYARPSEMALHDLSGFRVAITNWGNAWGGKSNEVRLLALVEEYRTIENTIIAEITAQQHVH